MTERFSARVGLTRPANGLIYDSIPVGVADGFCNLMRRVPESIRAGMRQFVCDSLDIYCNDFETVYGWDDIDHFRTFLLQNVNKTEWYGFYDLTEVIWLALEGKSLGPGVSLQDDFENEVNGILRRNFVGYELRKGRIERVGANVTDAAIAEARGILRDAQLKGPNDQFLKAVGFFSQRPAPDAENCVKEAIGAVEGMARILLKNDSILLSSASKELVKRGKLHPTLQKVIDGLYAYRGAAEGVGHGRTGERNVMIEDAEFVLNTAAAVIVYLARLYGVGVVT